MYKVILDTGEILGYASEIRYIRKGLNGCYQQCKIDRAEGVAFKSTPYSLDTEGRLDGAVGTVHIYEFSEADEAFLRAENMTDVRAALEEIYEMIIEKGE